MAVVQNIAHVFWKYVFGNNIIKRHGRFKCYESERKIYKFEIINLHIMKTT
jgi:hypothetical protein